ncbi:MAG TPA: polysaccharide deacetylase family protein [Myxococcales bacterium]|nr:polysaccharide deacetylase family protein [Myxococcales bacterium]
MSARLFSVSVDLDGLGCYAAIHGLAPSRLGERAQRAVPEVALERFAGLFEAEGIRATFFAIGREIEEVPGAAQALGRAARAGHEIGAHSWAHDYALSRRAPAEIDADLARCDDVLARATGAKPRGFRAPGYTLSQTLLAAVSRRGYLYDSSLLPSPAYYLVKAVALALHSLAGRSSQSILGGVGQLFAPRGAHWLAGMRELPIATLPLLRGPVIGTVVLGAPDALSTALARAAFASGHLNLELHGIDLLDATDAGSPELGRLQPGLKMPAAEKERRLRALLRTLRARAEPCTLEQAALRLL